MTYNPIRWSDNDQYFGPFTYSCDQNNFRHFALILGSGDNDDYPGCRLRLSAFGHTLIVALPSIVKPWTCRVVPGWDAATIQRLGRNWYDNSYERQYGVSYGDGFFQVFFGRQTNDSSTTQDWATFLPWTQWRHVRHETFGVPVEFDFLDFDGQALTATTLIGEHEWRFGEGIFKWLTLLRKPIIRRSLEISFSGETGRHKGSWKGGTIGHGIDMTPGEQNESAFRRYCQQHQMTFVSEAIHATGKGNA